MSDIVELQQYLHAASRREGGGVVTSDWLPSGDKCGACWGSHACGLAPHAEGNHQCLDEDGSVCIEVDQDGVDRHGFQWAMYGIDLNEPWPDTPE